jgi:hypothetical protein
LPKPSILSFPPFLSTTPDTIDDCSNQLPVLDSSTVFTFLESEDRRTINEVALPSLDELFQLKPTTDNGTTTTSTTSSSSTPTTTMRQCGGAKLVLDGYAYMKKGDLKKGTGFAQGETGGETITTGWG